MRQNQKKSKKRKSKKARKPKVYIPAYKIIIFCCVIILICMTLLLVTTIKSSQRPETSSILERYEKMETKSQKNERRTENQKNSESADDKENLQKNENQKSAEKEKNAENRQNRTKNPAQNESKKGIDEQKSQELQTQPPNQNLNQKEAENSQKKSGKAEENRNAENSKKSERKNENDEQAKSQKNERPAPAQNQEKNPSDSASAENSQKTTKYNFPAAKNNAQLIFVFDDGGQNLSQLDAFLKLPVPITVAVLPRLEFSKQAAQKIRDSGNEAILHQPMQAINLNVNPGLGAITPQMTDEEIISVLFYNINEIGPVSGMNNHEGSAITADAEKTAVILKVASDEGIYFLDSRTNSETKVPYVSKQLGYSYYERNIFLDNEKTKENALNELKRGLDLANKNGSVIMFGHIWSADFLPDFILEVLPELQEKGYTFCTVSKSNAIKR